MFGIITWILSGLTALYALGAFCWLISGNRTWGTLGMAILGLWIFPIIIVGFIVLCEEYNKPYILVWGAEWTLAREAGRPSAETTAGKRILNGRNAFPERGDLYQVLERIDQKIDAGDSTPKQHQGEIISLIRQSGGVYDPLSGIFALAAAAAFTGALFLAGVLGKLAWN